MVRMHQTTQSRPWQQILYLCLATILCELVKAGKLAQPDYGMYHTERDLFGKVSRMVSDNDHMRLDSYTGRDGNYSVRLDVVTVDWQREDVNVRSEKLRVLLDFGAHARELISAEVGLHLLQLLADPEMMIDQYSAVFGTSSASDLLRLLQCCMTLQVLPMSNRSGRLLVEQRGQLCERKNGRGVDLNRNWDVHWGFKEVDYSAAEENPGSFPLSEPEVQLVRNVAVKLQPHLWVAVHSGMAGLFMPYDHKQAIADGPHDKDTLDILNLLNKGLCNLACTVGSGGASVGYLAHGTATDYMYAKLHVPVAMTWEVYGDESAGHEDCFKAFNPVEQEVYARTLQIWTNALLQTFVLMKSHSAVSFLGLTQPQASEGPRRVRHRAPPSLNKGRAGLVAPTALSRRSSPAPAVTGFSALQGHQNAQAFQVDNEQKNLLTGLFLFSVTVAAWCVTRQCLKQRRVRVKHPAASCAS